MFHISQYLLFTLPEEFTNNNIKKLPPNKESYGTQKTHYFKLIYFQFNLKPKTCPNCNQPLHYLIISKCDYKY